MDFDVFLCDRGHGPEPDREAPRPRLMQAGGAWQCWPGRPVRPFIQEHGPDWRRMGTTGVAAAPMPGRVPRAEMDAVFLCESLDDVEFFVGFGLHPSVDVWEVDTEGLVIEAKRTNTV
jgi:hypothetical protein